MIKSASIKKLVETQTLDSLRKAEKALVEERAVPITIEGEDAGEKLTYVLAAIWILEKMHQEGVDFSLALRAYAKRIRRSIN